MRYIEVDNSTIQLWVTLENTMFPDDTREESEKGCRDALASGTQTAFVCLDDADVPIGYVHAALRTDYVEGAVTSPVGFLEAIYVEPPFRGRGIARELARLAEKWAAGRGCTEMGSDAELTNTDSHAFHQRIGFKEVNRIVAFLKPIA